jgi:hypothetical protein
VENFVLSQDLGKLVVGKQFLVTNDVYYKSVYKSSKLGIKKVEKTGQRRFWLARKIKRKCILLSFNGKT